MQADSQAGAINESISQLEADLASVVNAVGGASQPPPSGGSVAAAVGALAAALTRMVAGLTAGRPKYAHVFADMQDIAQRAELLSQHLLELVRRDATAYEAVGLAYRLPRDTDDAVVVRTAAIRRAMIPAIEAPLEVARAAASVAELAADVAERGNINAVADAAVAALLAEAVCKAAMLTVRVNASAINDAQEAFRLTRAAMNFVSAASAAAARAVVTAERAC
jgi:formiminotetrahydrofolate cyclodeaminase